MDSQKTTTTIGVVLIFMVFAVWLYFMNEQQAKMTKQHKPVAADTSRLDTGHAGSPQQMAAAAVDSTPFHADSTSANRSSVFTFASDSLKTTKTVETPLFTATISGMGGAISSFVLHKYNTWDKKPVELVSTKDPLGVNLHDHGADINLKFVASDGKTVSTNDLPFTFDSKPITLAATDSTSFSAFYRLDSGRYIEKIFHFSGAGYLIGIEYKFAGLTSAISGYHYTAELSNALPFVERRSADELTNAKAFVGVAGEMEELSVSKQGLYPPKAVNGDIAYAGMRTQYFEKAMMPVGVKSNRAEFSAVAVPASDGGVVVKFLTGFDVPIGHSQIETLGFNLYFGPLEYERVAALGVGLEHSMNFGWSFLVRPISIHLMMPLFLWLHGFISNWGIVIIVFSILIKLLTIPLSTGQMRSMRKMQVLQPKVTEVRDKFKDDPKKMNEELLKVYKTYGVNPAGGCLPMLLQMPILFALYSVLRNVIQLRQAPFGLWIDDLSVPDALIHFGGKLPLLGWETLSGLTLLLVITMFVQQMYTVTDPRQKQMAYIMPIIFIFMFNNLPSGVGLYYFMFNIFGLCQQFYLTKIATPPTLEEMLTDPKKSKGGGIMGRLQAMEQQQRESRKQQYTGKGLPPGKSGKKK